ncbi:MAG: 4-hydroxy-tetrahydrodipicolinate synthase [Planctomycetes bacterium]|nr:4-hydroxy-tetrahydrodipicolinate synthase [Planctomycetota bacterium]
MSGKGKDFRGVYVASVTPMTQSCEVDYDMLSKYVDGLVNDGVHGIIPLGSTGEFYALTPQERQDVLKGTLEAVDGRVPVLAGTNASSTADVVEYSKQAEKLGADGLLLAAPYYSLPTLDELYEHFKAVNDAVGIPIMLYNYPGRTGVDLVPDFVERLTALNNVKYIKESTGDVTRVSEIIKRIGDRIGVFCGGDLIPLESFVLGAIGWVGGIANVLPKSHVKLYELAVVKGDIPAAREFFYEIFYALQAIETCGKYTQYVKAGCEIMGNPVGPPRMPLMPVSNEDYAKLKEILSTISSEGV